MVTARGRARFTTDLLEWLEVERTPATVYFAHSAGVDAAIEALRRETRIAQVILLEPGHPHATSAARRSNIEPEVAAIGMVSLIESAASSWLTQDAVFLGLGRRRFVDETGQLAQRMVECARLNHSDCPTTAVAGGDVFESGSFFEVADGELDDGVATVELVDASTEWPGRDW